MVGCPGACGNFVTVRLLFCATNLLCKRLLACEHVTDLHKRMYIYLCAVSVFVFLRHCPLRSAAATQVRRVNFTMDKPFSVTAAYAEGADLPVGCSSEIGTFKARRHHNLQERTEEHACCCCASFHVCRAYVCPRLYSVVHISVFFLPQMGGWALARHGR